MRLFEMLKKIDVNFDNVDDFEVRSILPLDLATQNDISYIENDKYLPLLGSSKAGAIFVNEKYKNDFKHKNIIFVPNPHLAFASLTQFFKASQIKNKDSQKNIKESTQVTIMQGVFIGENVTIGDNSTIMPNVVICDNVKIGNNCNIYPNVVIYKDCIIGNNVNIHAGSVIGSDGFGYAHTNKGEHVKIEHFGNVIIEDDVEIGANTTIDRAVFNSTIIKKGVKIDNLVQVGHNCIIGEHSILVAQVGFSGSTITGRNVVCGGQVGTKGHLHIGDFVQIAARGGVSKNLPSNTKWAGYPIEEFSEWKKAQVIIKRLIKTMKS